MRMCLPAAAAASTLLAVDVLRRADRHDIDAGMPQGLRQVVVEGHVGEPGFGGPLLRLLDAAIANRHHVGVGIVDVGGDVLRGNPARPNHQDSVSLFAHRLLSEKACESV